MDILLYNVLRVLVFTSKQAVYKNGVRYVGWVMRHSRRRRVMVQIIVK